MVAHIFPSAQEITALGKVVADLGLQKWAALLIALLIIAWGYRGKHGAKK